MLRPRISLAIHQVRDYLADREGLTGKSRESFFNLLDDYDAFKPVRQPRRWGTLLLCAILLSLMCGLVDRPARDWVDQAVWPGCFLSAIVPVWCIRRLEAKRRSFDPSTEWCAYCLFLRPIILAERPGLLDRNRVSPPRMEDSAPPRAIVILRDLVRLRGPDCWWSALIGLWQGMFALLLLRYAVADPARYWTILLPAAGFLGGPLVCVLWQAAAYSVALLDPRLRNTL